MPPVTGLCTANDSAGEGRPILVLDRCGAARVEPPSGARSLLRHLPQPTARDSGLEVGRTPTSPTLANAPRSGRRSYANFVRAPCRPPTCRSLRRKTVEACFRGWKRRSTKPPSRSRIRAARTRYGVSIVPSIKTPSGICCPLDIDATSLLPPDESGHGFDNVTVGDLSPALLDRYISAAQKISRLAIGSTQTSLQSDIIRVPPDVTQEEHVPGLPIGTRGGVSVRYTFAQDGEYDIQIWLARGYNGNIEGLKDPQPHEIQLLLDRTPIGTLTVQKPADGDDSLLDRDFKIRVPVTAGPHQVGVTFLRNSSSLIETARQPLQSHFNERRHPRITPAINQVSITGPYAPHGADNTPSRRRIFVCRPTGPGDEEACAKKILSTLMRRAYRRSISEADVERPMAFYREGRSDGDFDAGIEKALSAVLVNPEYLFRVELDPETVSAGAAYRISDLELASRLSFFLWSSLPDDELLDAAVRGELRQPDVLDRQVRRMLADPRSYNLASNFAGQWLRLRNLASVEPNVRLYPDFDDNLRQAFRLETELFVDSVRARRSQRARPAQGGLHLSQRAAGEALRDSPRLRQPLPARHARTRQQAWRIAAARQHPGRDVLCDADLAGDSWRVGPRATSSAPRRRPRSRMCRRSKKVPSPPTFRCDRG